MKENRFESDVLVIGGGFAGISAAITIKEDNPDTDVLLVEKYYAGYSGKSIRGAGAFLSLEGAYTPEEFVKFHTQYIGDYLNDQELWYDYAAKSAQNIRNIQRWSDSVSSQSGDVDHCLWGGTFNGLDENGNPVVIASPMPWTVCAIEYNHAIKMRNTAEKVGVRFIDRVGITDILTADGAAVGAMGFHLEKPERYIFSSKAVIIANGACNYRIMAMWNSGRGDGVYAAWRAGADMANAEFGSFANWINLNNFEQILGCEPALSNAHGDKFGLRTRRPQDSDIEERTICEWYHQNLAGNGPVYYDPTQNLHHQDDAHAKFFFNYEIFNRPKANRYYGELFSNSGEYDEDKIVVVPGVISEFGPVRVDHSFATSIPGLFSAGDTCHLGSCAAGAVPAPPTRTRGGGLSFAVYSGVESGHSAAKYVQGMAKRESVNEAQIKSYTDEMFQPMTQPNGFSPYEILDRIQNVMGDIGRMVCHTGDRIADSLEKISSIQRSEPHTAAKDMHELFLCYENRAMLQCAELFFTSAYLREESRGWFVREDYPEKDDKNWLKWILLHNDQGKIRPEFINVPIERYWAKPEGYTGGEK